MDEKFNILFVDDTPIAQKVGQILFHKSGYLLDIADCGIKAFKMAQAKHYDLILMDIGLPDISGVDVTKKIRRQLPHYQTIPIIALTAHSDAKMKMEYINAGMVDVLIKPLDSTIVHNILNKYILKAA